MRHCAAACNYCDWTIWHDHIVDFDSCTDLGVFGEFASNISNFIRRNTGKFFRPFGRVIHNASTRRAKAGNYFLGVDYEFAFDGRIDQTRIIKSF